MTEVVWVLPCTSPTEADYTRVFPAVTKDLSVQGIAILHNAPINDQCVLVGLRDDTDWRFLACTPKHCIPLGYGHYQIGLFPDEVVLVSTEDFDTMRAALNKYGSPMPTGEQAAVDPDEAMLRRSLAVSGVDSAAQMLLAPASACRAQCRVPEILHQPRMRNDGRGHLARRIAFRDLSPRELSIQNSQQPAEIVELAGIVTAQQFRHPLIVAAFQSLQDFAGMVGKD